MKKNKLKIFIASSTESKKCAEFIAGILEGCDNVEHQVWWNHDTFISGRTTLNEVLRAAMSCDAGIFLLGADDYLCKKENIEDHSEIHALELSTRDNVLIEAGIFYGMKGAANVCLCSLKDVRIPSDLEGITRIVYDESKRYTMKIALEDWIKNIKKQSGVYVLSAHGIKDSYPVFIANKSDIEKNLPLADRALNAKEIRIMNYAGTSFLASGAIGSTYKHDWREWFETTLKEEVNITLILTKPGTPAAEDAASYKMYPPHGNKTDPKEIIPSNRAKVQELKDKNKNIKLDARETEVALPYALIETIFDDTNENHIKVDLYSPYTYNDDKRPSFMVYRNDNTALYEHFSSVIDHIMANATPIDLKEESNNETNIK